VGVKLCPACNLVVGGGCTCMIQAQLGVIAGLLGKRWVKCKKPTYPGEWVDQCVNGFDPYDYPCEECGGAGFVLVDKDGP